MIGTSSGKRTETTRPATSETVVNLLVFSFTKKKRLKSSNKQERFAISLHQKRCAINAATKTT